MIASCAASLISGNGLVAHAQEHWPVAVDVGLVGDAVDVNDGVTGIVGEG